MKAFITSMISAVVLMASLLFQSPAMALAAPFFQSSGQFGAPTSRVEAASQQAGGRDVDRITKAIVAKDNRLVNKAVN